MNSERILEVAVALKDGYFDDPKDGRTVHISKEGLTATEVLCQVSGIGEWMPLDGRNEKVCIVNGRAWFNEFPPEITEYYGWDFKLSKIPEALFSIWQQFLKLNPSFPRQNTDDWTLYVGLLENPLNISHSEISDLISNEIGLGNADEGQA